MKALRTLKAWKTKTELLAIMTEAAMIEARLWAAGAIEKRREFRRWKEAVSEKCAYEYTRFLEGTVCARRTFVRALVKQVPSLRGEVAANMREARQRERARQVPAIKAPAPAGTAVTEARLNDLINAHGSIQLALEARNQCIARRKAEGKASPVAEAEAAALIALPWDYRTPAQKAREEADALTCRD